MRRSVRALPAKKDLEVGALLSQLSKGLSRRVMRVRDALTSTDSALAQQLLDQATELRARVGAAVRGTRGLAHTRRSSVIEKQADRLENVRGAVGDLRESIQTIAVRRKFGAPNEDEILRDIEQLEAALERSAWSSAR
jgi:hypothetical protein